MVLKNKILNKFRYISLHKYPRLFRPTSEPYISGDTFRKNADHIFDETQTFNVKAVKKRDIVFLKTDFLEMYFNYYHPKILNEYILITHNSDIEIGEKERGYFDDKLIHWFASNLVINKDECFSPIPLGLENRRFLSNGRLKNFKKVSKNKINKKNNIMSSFSTHTNPEIRSNLLDKTKDMEFVNITKSYSQLDYLKNLNEYKFNLCPEGNAVETHRFWESLTLNVLPICQNNINNFNYFEMGVPMVLIDQWELIDKYDFEYFLKYLDDFKIQDFKKYSSFSYWWNNIYDKKVK